MEINFEFRLPSGPKSSFVIISGGADADRDGRIEDDTEIAAFVRDKDNTWTRKQEVAAQTKDMLFAVTFTVGAGVPWSLKITDPTGKALFTGANTTMFPSETVSYVLE